MAQVIPNLEGVKATSTGMQRELDVVALLRENLPQDYVVFHGVLWSAKLDGGQQFGEVDVIVLAPSGKIGLLEVKAGQVIVNNKGISKAYVDGNKDVSWQLNMQYGALRNRLRKAKLDTEIAQYLVIPDMRFDGEVVRLPRVWIVDKMRFRSLPGEVIKDLAGAPNPELFAKLQAFFGNIFQLPIDPSETLQWLNEAVHDLAEGLATWMPRLRAPAGLFRVHATAGGGKTQLALRLFEQARDEGLSLRYVCFNRPLADYLRVLAKGFEVSVSTYHELAVDALRTSCQEPLDFASPAVFAEAESYFAEHTPDVGQFDVLVIDEAQDFSSLWLDVLLRQRKPGGRAYVLQDEAQQLYLRQEAPNAQLAEAVEIDCWDNFRSPRRIVQAINALALTREPVIPRCPIEGQLPFFHTWPEDDADGMRTLERVVSNLLHEGIKAKNIALLSYAGLKRSKLLTQDNLAKLPLRKFSGAYDDQGQPHWTQGKLLAESLHRFKGQAAPVVVMCEVDFNALDTLTKNRLFVGMTRAQWRLEVVLSEQAERVLMAALSGGE